MQITRQWTVNSEGFLLDAVHQFDPLEERHEVPLHGLREPMLVGEHHAD